MQSPNFSSVTHHGQSVRSLCAQGWLRLAFIIAFTVSDTVTAGKIVSEDWDVNAFRECKIKAQ